MLIGIDASRAVVRQRTGTEAYAFFLIQELIPQAAARGHRVRLYFNRPPPADLFPAASHVETAVIPFPRLWTHVRLAWELHRRPPDLFFTPAHVIPLSYRGPAVATIHDLGYRYFPDAHPTNKRLYLEWSTRHNSRRSRRIIADSQATRDDLARFYSIDVSKIDVVYPGIEPTLGPVDDEGTITAVLAHYQITSPYLLYLGTLQPRKNLVRVIDAYAKSNIPHRLVLAGKVGWRAQPILDKISDLQSPLSEKILLPGYVNDDDKAALLSGATALIFPSLYEGFGFPILEAQACATPVITATTSSCPEVAGDAALLVDPLYTNAISQAIQRLCRSPTLQDELRHKGLLNVKRFSWKKTATTVLATLEKGSN